MVGKALALVQGGGVQPVVEQEVDGGAQVHGVIQKEKFR